MKNSNYQKHTFGGKYQQEVWLNNYQYQLFMAALRKPRAKVLMNELKQTSITNTVSALFNGLFPNARYSPAVQILIYPIKDTTFTPTFKLAELGISRASIIKKLINHNVLPNDFYSLKQAA